MPSHSVGRQLLQIINEPLAAPSANLSGRPSPTTFNHVYQDLNGRIDGIVQAEQSEEGLESTVLDCTSFLINCKTWFYNSSNDYRNTSIVSPMLIIMILNSQLHQV